MATFVAVREACSAFRVSSPRRLCCRYYIIHCVYPSRPLPPCTGSSSSSARTLRSLLWSKLLWPGANRCALVSNKRVPYNTLYLNSPRRRLVHCPRTGPTTHTRTTLCAHLMFYICIIFRGGKVAYDIVYCVRYTYICAGGRWRAPLNTWLFRRRSARSAVDCECFYR